MKRSAECCCGACVIEAVGEPEIYGLCSCSNCRKRTGSAFGISAYFNKENIRDVRGDFKTYALESPIGPQLRRFCANCGTTLSWDLQERNNMIGIAAGCFIGDAIPMPEFCSHGEALPDWLSLDAAISDGYQS